MISLIPGLPIVVVVLVFVQAALGPPRHRLHPAILALGVLLALVGFTVAWLWSLREPGLWGTVGYVGWALMMVGWTAMAQQVFAEDDDEHGDDGRGPDVPDDPDGIGPEDPEEPEFDWDTFEREFGVYADRELTYH